MELAVSKERLPVKTAFWKQRLVFIIISYLCNLTISSSYLWSLDFSFIKRINRKNNPIYFIFENPSHNLFWQAIFVWFLECANFKVVWSFNDRYSTLSLPSFYIYSCFCLFFG